MTTRRRASYANVMSTVAVVLALTTSSAYAAGLAKNSVRSKHIAANAIKAKHIASNAVQGSDISNGAVGAKALAKNAVDSSTIQDGSLTAADLAASSVGNSELANSSVTDSKIATSSVGTSEIKNGSITGEDVAPDAISSSRMTVGVKRLLFDAGTLPVNQVYGDFTVSSSSWPGGAPTSGAQMTATWTQPADGLDVVSGFARVAYPSGCTNTAGTARGMDVKIVDEDGRVISASSTERADGTNYNGNGFWNQQVDLPGVQYRVPNSATEDALVDYIHLPFEMAEFLDAGSHTVRVYFKRNSTSCSPTVTDARIIVYRYADES